MVEPAPPPGLPRPSRRVRGGRDDPAPARARLRAALRARRSAVLQAPRPLWLATSQRPVVGRGVAACTRRSSHDSTSSWGVSCGTATTRPRRGESWMRRQVSGRSIPKSSSNGISLVPCRCCTPRFCGAVGCPAVGGVQVPSAASGVFRRMSWVMSDGGEGGRRDRPRPARLSSRGPSRCTPASRRAPGRGGRGRRAR